MQCQQCQTTVARLHRMTRYSPRVGRWRPIQVCDGCMGSGRSPREERGDAILSYLARPDFAGKPPKDAA